MNDSKSVVVFLVIVLVLGIMTIYARNNNQEVPEFPLPEVESSEVTPTEESANP